MTSSLSVTDLKGNIFGCTIYPPSLIVIAFLYLRSYGGGWGGGNSPLAPEDKKKQKNKKRVDVGVKAIGV